MGWLDRRADFLSDPNKRFSGDPHLSGKNGGYTLSLHELRSSGIKLLGRIDLRNGSILKLRGDVKAALQASDRYGNGISSVGRRIHIDFRSNCSSADQFGIARRTRG